MLWCYDRKLRSFSTEVHVIVSANTVTNGPVVVSHLHLRSEATGSSHCQTTALSPIKLCCLSAKCKSTATIALFFFFFWYVKGAFFSRVNSLILTTCFKRSGILLYSWGIEVWVFSNSNRWGATGKSLKNEQANKQTKTLHICLVQLKHIDGYRPDQTGDTVLLNWHDVLCL